MKQSIEKRDPSVLIDYLALAITTFGVGYLPVAPGTFGSIVGVVIYLLFAWAEAGILIHLGQLGWRFEQVEAFLNAGNLVLFFLFCLIGIWAAGRSTELLGNTDPPQAVVD